MSINVFQKMRLLNDRRANGDLREASEILKDIEADYMALNPFPSPSDIVGAIKRVGGSEKKLFGDGSEK